MEKDRISLSHFILRHAAFFLGTGIGALGGLSSLPAGLLIGLLIDQVRIQRKMNRAVCVYLENPGRSDFEEPSPGLAAYCALGVLMLSEQVSWKRKRHGNGIHTALREKLIHNAISCFLLEDSSLPVIDSYCRLAEDQLDKLNPDLLMESLVARRRYIGDLERLCKHLGEFVVDKRAFALYSRIQWILDPQGTDDQHTTVPDPWVVLGLDPHSSLEDVKATFRRLAVQFHPDSFQNFEQEQRKAATEAFLRIKEAYRQLMHERGQSGV